MTSAALLRALEARGWRAAVVPVGRLADLRAEIERRRSEVSPAVMAVVDRNLDFTAARRGRRAALAHRGRRAARLRAGHRGGGRRDGERADPDHLLSPRRDPGRGGPRHRREPRAVPASSAARMMLPEKLLAVCAGLARYGRNNIAYVDGWGSFVELVDLRLGARPGRRSLDRPAGARRAAKPARPAGGPARAAPSARTAFSCTASSA